MIQKLWQKHNQDQLHTMIESFETTDDLMLDQKLVSYDCIASMVHARMLEKIGILSKSEAGTLIKTLKEILQLDARGKFQLEAGDEDVHTKIENFLVQACGEAGKKIHTGRSRNDQVLTALRLYIKDQISLISNDIEKFIQSFACFSNQYGKIPMPGYTHMQKAMPSSIALWSGSISASLKDDLGVLKQALTTIDQSPLGSAAGYGSPIPLDRAYTSNLLRFSNVQENSLYCQNSRGKFEGIVVSSLVNLLLTLNKFAGDILLFTTREFSFFTIDDCVCTGSSIMPQKKNVDIAELIRSKVHIVLGHYVSIVSMTSNLVSGYNRDMQDTKKPLFESLDITHHTLLVAGILLDHIKPNTTVLKQAMTPELFATHHAIELVQKGIPFRDAYKKIGEKLRRRGINK
jgi:argininosuccinate lyase